MRILHTSDLHIGKLLHGHSLLEDQRHVFAQITQAVVEQQPDALIVAGDIFDRSIPPVGAVALLGEWLTGLRSDAPDVPIVIISGNHDNGKRLAWASALLDPMIHLRGDPEDLERPIHFTTRTGERAGVGHAVSVAGCTSLARGRSQQPGGCVSYGARHHRRALRRHTTRFWWRTVSRVGVPSDSSAGWWGRPR